MKNAPLGAIYFVLTIVLYLAGTALLLAFDIPITATGQWSLMILIGLPLFGVMNLHSYYRERKEKEEGKSEHKSNH